MLEAVVSQAMSISAQITAEVKVESQSHKSSADQEGRCRLDHLGAQSLSLWACPRLGLRRVHSSQVDFFAEFLDEEGQLFCGLGLLLQQLVAQAGDILLDLLQLTCL